MKIFRQLKRWLSPPGSRPVAPIQMADLVETTIRDIIPNDVQVRLDNTEQYILVWVHVEGFIDIPIDFEITELYRHCRSGSAFVNHIKLKLKEAGVEC